MQRRCISAFFYIFAGVRKQNVKMTIKLYEKDTSMKDVERIVRTLKDGGVIIYPTDSVYAMGCDIFAQRAVETVCRYKEMDPRKASLSFICDELAMVSDYAKMNNDAFKLMKKNLPGAFTFILEGNNRLPKTFKQKKTVGIRIPDNEIVRTIVRELGNPLMTTSLKRDDDEILEYYTDPELIDEKFGKDVDLVIDGGIGSLEPTTVVDMTGDEGFVVTREGKGELQY